jgi:hypothetical protein
MELPKTVRKLPHLAASRAGLQRTLANSVGNPQMRNRQYHAGLFGSFGSRLITRTDVDVLGGKFRGETAKRSRHIRQCDVQHALFVIGHPPRTECLLRPVRVINHKLHVPHRARTARVEGENIYLRGTQNFREVRQCSWKIVARNSELSRLGHTSTRSQKWMTCMLSEPNAAMRNLCRPGHGMTSPPLGMPLDRSGPLLIQARVQEPRTNSPNICI